MMETFGRFEFDPQGSGIDAAYVWESFQAPLLPLTQTDPDAFVTSLAEAVVHVGGWAAYGAAHTVMNLLDGRLDHSSYRAILEVSLQFLRDNGVPNNRLNGYEWEFWLNNQGQSEPWLPGRPTPQQGSVTDLDADEVRRIAQLNADKESNVIYVRHDNGNGYVAVIDSVRSSEDPQRVQTAWLGAETLHDLYLGVGETLQAPPYWFDEELEAYFPLGKAKI
jgi:hypothetical protein